MPSLSIFTPSARSSPTTLQTNNSPDQSRDIKEQKSLPVVHKYSAQLRGYCPLRLVRDYRSQARRSCLLGVRVWGVLGRKEGEVPHFEQVDLKHILLSLVLYFR